MSATDRGVVTPFRRDGKGDYANLAGVDLLTADVRELLAIRGASARAPGEVPWRTELGSRLYSLRHRNMDANVRDAVAVEMVSEAVHRWERRARVGRTRVVVDTAAGALHVLAEIVPLGYNAEAGVADVEVQGT